MKKITFILIIASLVIECTGVGSSTRADVNGASIREITEKLIKGAKSEEQKLERIFYFIRDKIKFDFVYPQNLPADEVLRLKKGVCMQKANLLVKMAREAGFKARFKFMYVRKNALEDFLPEFAYKRWMDPFPHTISEVYLNGKWISVEATFDKELHEICLKKELNFGKYSDLRNIPIEFSSNGVIGSQQLFQVKDMKVFYGDDLSPLIEYQKNRVPWYKKIFQPLIFHKASKIINKIRNQEK